MYMGEINPQMLQFGAIAFVFGLCVGSFLNVCIFRIPAGKSIVFPGSTCPQCHNAIRFYDNIPVLSYMLLGGKCREAAAVYVHADGSDPQEVEDNVRRFMDEGYRFIRVQMGGYGGKAGRLNKPDGAPDGNYFDPREYARQMLDMMTHVGQLMTLRRLAGAPVETEPYYRSNIRVGQVGSDQPLETA